MRKGRYEEFFATTENQGTRDYGIIGEMKSILFTLKTWPIVTAATIALCFLTKTVATWCGIDLPDQQNVSVVKQVLENASPRHFATAAFFVFQIVILAPILEELFFRGLLFRVPFWAFGKIRIHLPLSLFAIPSAALFSAAHYLTQPWPDAAFLALFFFGLAQCWIYTKTRHLGCAMLSHALFNLTNLVFLFIVPTE